MLAAGHQVIPCAFGGGGGQDGSGDLQEAFFDHSRAQGGHHLAAQNDIVFYRFVAQVEIAVFQAGAFISFAAAGDGERQLVVTAAAQHLDGLGHHLDVSGGQLGILAGPLAHRAGDAQSGLLIQLLELGQQGFVLHHQLGDAVKIAQHGKGQTGADLAHVIEKPGQLHALAGVFHAQLSASVAAVRGALLHRKINSYL